MARVEVVTEFGFNQKTTGEKWKSEIEGHWYQAAKDFAVEHLGQGFGRDCLVIGSPRFELKALEDLGWKTYYNDVRQPPFEVERFLQGDATTPQFAAACFEAVSSTCVLCHAGLGRYGDEVNLEHGDELMLREIYRILKPGGKAVLMFGPVSNIAKMIRRGTEHRIYTVPEAKRMLLAAGFEIGEVRIWDTYDSSWRPGIHEATDSIINCDYLCVMALKPA